MRCEAAEQLLSARLDGEAREEQPLDDHLAGCARCRAFQAGALRIRERVRLEPAAPVPDLVPAIMAEVRRGGASEQRIRPLPAWGRHAAAFAAGAVAAVLILTGLPGLRPPSSALATEIPREVASASRQVTAYRAAFDVLERHFHPEVPQRRFEVRVAFRAPERFRAAVTDLTAYPSGEWPRNDAVLAVDRDRWMLRGPLTCPRPALPACAAGGSEVRRVQGREPFDGDAPLPTDIVLPVGTLTGTSRVRVVGRDEVLGRNAVVIELAYRDATPLFGYLQAAGAWRPMFPLDRVLVSLDAESWFPLAYEVVAAPSPDRAQWALRNDLPIERPGALLLRVTARSFQPTVARIPVLPPAPGATDEGFRDSDLPSLPQGDGEVLVPRDLAGLRPYRAGTFAGGGRPGDEVLLSFSRGLAWLKVRQTRTWAGPDLFGDVTSLAAPVRLANEGIAYYEPATATLGRRLSIHASDVDLYLESNLPRGDLLRVAASIPVLGRAVPDGWLVRRGPEGIVRLQVPVDAARAAVPGLALPAPSSLPTGYRLWAVNLVERAGRTSAAVYFRRPGAELDGRGIGLWQGPGGELAPPLDPDVLRVRLDGTIARYAPSRGELEWIEDGAYHRLTAPTLPLTALLRVALSLESG
jgi:hypothetical protein